MWHRFGGIWLCRPSSQILILESFLKNRAAEKGGGLSLEIKVKVYILKYNDVIEDPFDTNTTIFTANNADYGEAADVDDDTNSRDMC